MGARDRRVLRTVPSNKPQQRVLTTSPLHSLEETKNYDDVCSPALHNSLEHENFLKEDEKARIENDKAEVRRQKLLAKKKKATQETRAEREIKAKQLDDLLANCAKFSDILTKKTEVLGRVGSGFDEKTLGEHKLELAKQPDCMIGGIMRDYQLEGLTWMFEICLQGMSGILADEMGLGKTIQTISLLAKFREDANYLGPHLIVAPLSTLSNWRDEFQKWVPSIPVAFYHGTPDERKEIFQKKLQSNLIGGRVNEKFPVVLSTPEIVIRDVSNLSRINWEIIIIDEGHRLKNSESKFFRILRTFTSVTRFLITGTPLQNNLKELWSLLNFLLPNIFVHWEQFESWFDFSDLQDEVGTEEFLQDQMKQDLVKKIHLILQPLLLRRVKADVEHLLPKKREYILYAPMTRQQVDLYNAISDTNTNTREYLQRVVLEHLERNSINTASRSIKPSSEHLRGDGTKIAETFHTKKVSEKRGELLKPLKVSNAFEKMMNIQPNKSTNSSSKKRKKLESDTILERKSTKSNQISTPGASAREKRRSRRKIYAEAYSSDEDVLSDEEFEAKLVREAVDTQKKFKEANEKTTPESKNIEIAKREISNKKLGNPVMQLRLTCNSPYNFYTPWSINPDQEIDETIVTSSGKMLLLDRLLPALFSRDSKVLIFSQFKTQLNILEDYARGLRKWKVCRIDGSVTQEERQRQIKEFNENLEYRIFLLSTRAGGQGINLASADTVILYDSDWNPQQDLQAQDRAHRIGQKNPVIIYRLATRGTVEEDLLLSADAKRRLEKLVIKKGDLKSMTGTISATDTTEDGDIDTNNLADNTLRSILLKDGLVYQYKGGDQILNATDLEILCDRSDDAYRRAASGFDDSNSFRIVETKPGAFMTCIKKIKNNDKT